MYDVCFDFARSYHADFLRDAGYAFFWSGGEAVSVPRNSRAITFAQLEELTEAVRERIKTSGEAADNFEIELYPRSSGMKIYLLKLNPDRELDIVWQMEKRR